MHPLGCGGHRGQAGHGIRSPGGRRAGARSQASESSTHEVHLCLAVHVVEEGECRTRLEIDPEPDLVLEFNEAAELAQLLDVLVAAERGEHPGEVALRGYGRPECLAKRLANCRTTEVVVAACAGRHGDDAQFAVRRHDCGGLFGVELGLPHGELVEGLA